MRSLNIAPAATGETRIRWRSARGAGEAANVTDYEKEEVAEAEESISADSADLAAAASGCGHRAVRFEEERARGQARTSRGRRATAGGGARTGRTRRTTTRPLRRMGRSGFARRGTETPLYPSDSESEGGDVVAPA